MKILINSIFLIAAVVGPVSLLMRVYVKFAYLQSCALDKAPIRSQAHPTSNGSTSISLLLAMIPLPLFLKKQSHESVKSLNLRKRYNLISICFASSVIIIAFTGVISIILDQ